MPKQYFEDNPEHVSVLLSVTNQQQREHNAAATAWQQYGQRGSNRLSNREQQYSNRFLTQNNATQQPISLIPVEKFRESRRHYEKNNFTLFLKVSSVLR